MKNRLWIVGLLFVAFGINSCSNDSISDDSVPSDYVIFGNYYGLCGGNCFQVYKMSDGSLYKDTTVAHYMGEYTFHPSMQLSEEMYNYAHQLLNDIPVDLLGGGSSTLGCPDCYDQGGYYFSNLHNGEKTIFTIDPAITADQSQEVLAYKAKIKMALDSLN